MQPNQTEMITITLDAGDSEGSINSGPTTCESGVAPPTEVGEPINVTNGNMYIQQTATVCRGLAKAWKSPALTTAGSNLPDCLVMAGARYLMNRL